LFVFSPTSSWARTRPVACSSAASRWILRPFALAARRRLLRRAIPRRRSQSNLHQGATASAPAEPPSDSGTDRRHGWHTEDRCQACPLPADLKATESGKGSLTSPQTKTAQACTRYSCLPDSRNASTDASRPKRSTRIQDSAHSSPRRVSTATVWALRAQTNRSRPIRNRLAKPSRLCDCEQCRWPYPTQSRSRSTHNQDPDHMRARDRQIHISRHIRAVQRHASRVPPADTKNLPAVIQHSPPRIGRHSAVRASSAGTRPCRLSIR
jgi:hypothetical protein